jgi:hypothetical protein
LKFIYFEELPRRQNEKASVGFEWIKWIAFLLLLLQKRLHGNFIGTATSMNVNGQSFQKIKVIENCWIS